jgi:hypothetical protein
VISLFRSRAHGIQIVDTIVANIPGDAQQLKAWGEDLKCKDPRALSDAWLNQQVAMMRGEDSLKRNVINAAGNLRALTSNADLVKTASFGQGTVSELAES